MAEEKVEAGAINFRLALPWTQLFRSFQVALDPRKLLLAAAGILAMAAGWWLLAVIFYAPQSNRPSLGDFPESAYRPRDEADAKAADAQARRDAWKAFKEARRKWNLLHQAAGTREIKPDAGDMAGTREEYEKLQPVFDKLDREREKGISEARLREEILTGKQYGEAGEKWLEAQQQQIPYGTLRTWPFAENRGANPFLLITGQAERWEPGHFWDWFLTQQLPVLVEPLIKFFLPIRYLLSPEAGFVNRLYFSLVTLWTLAVWALFGGAITRMAAVQVARNEKIGILEAIRFVGNRYLSFLAAPLFPLLFVGVCVLFLMLFGVFHMIPYFGDIIVDGLFWFLPLLGGLAMAVVLVGLVGWPLMSATISAEGSDSFDAISRSYSYVYQGPWHYIWNSLVALVYGAMVVFFVGFMGSMVVYLGKWGVSQGTVERRDPSFLFVYAPESFGWRTLLLQGATVDGEPLVENGRIQPRAYAKFVGNDSNYTGKDRMTWYNHVGAFLVMLWLGLFFLIILGFGYSYFWSASTIIYLLMRSKVDDTDFDEVYLEEEETEEYPIRPAATTPPAPATTGQQLTMVEAPTLRGSSTPSSASTSSSPASPPARSETPSPTPARTEPAAAAPSGSKTEGDGSSPSPAGAE